MTNRQIKRRKKVKSKELICQYCKQDHLGVSVFCEKYPRERNPMTKQNEGQEVAFPFFIPDETKGELMSPGLAQLDYACIHLKVPRTGKPWLDALIVESLRNEMAGRAMQGILCNNQVDSAKLQYAKMVYKIADAMISTGKGEDAINQNKETKSL